MSIQFLSHVHLTRLDGIKYQLGDPLAFDIDQVRLEESFRSLKSFSSDSNDTTVWKSVWFYQESRFLGQLLFCSNVISDVAKLFFHQAHRFKVRRVVESVSSQKQELDEVSCDFSTSNVKSTDQMGKGKALIDGADMRHTITRIYHNPCQQALSVQGENRLDLNVG
eukprot:10093.XXX_21477_21974_1 [CDS] Oithona nana genome sequencing.